MKFNDWTLEDLQSYLSQLPSSPLLDCHNKIKFWGEIHIDNSEQKEADKETNPCRIE